MLGHKIFQTIYFPEVDSPVSSYSQGMVLKEAFFFHWGQVECKAIIGAQLSETLPVLCMQQHENDMSQ